MGDQIMKNMSSITKYAVLGLVIAGLGLAFSGYFDKDKQGVTVDVRVPELSVTAARGKVAFDANCAQCHGKNAWVTPDQSAASRATTRYRRG